MEAYTSFAEVYDTFMDNVPYEEWADYLEDRLKEYGNKRRAGSGTGMRNRKHDGTTGRKRI